MNPVRALFRCQFWGSSGVKPSSVIPFALTHSTINTVNVQASLHVEDEVCLAARALPLAEATSVCVLAREDGNKHLRAGELEEALAQYGNAISVFRWFEDESEHRHVVDLKERNTRETGFASGNCGATFSVPAYRPSPPNKHGDGS